MHPRPPDVIGQTIGEMVAGSMTGRGASRTGAPNTGKTPQTAKQVIDAVCQYYQDEAVGTNLYGLPEGFSLEDATVLPLKDYRIDITETEEIVVIGKRGSREPVRTSTYEREPFTGYWGQWAAVRQAGADADPVEVYIARPAGQWMQEHPRVMGGVQAVGGVFEMAAGGTAFVAGVGTSEFGVGIPIAIGGGALALHGADDFQAGLRTAFGGRPTLTYTNQGLQALGATPEEAAWMEFFGTAGAGGIASRAGMLGPTNGTQRIGAFLADESGSVGGANYFSRLQGEFRSFDSFESFKDVFGRAGDDLDWHHIVEQTPENVSRFGSAAIHNTENIVVIDRTVHAQISGYYSSIQPRVTGSTTLTVREWIGVQSLSAQQRFGERVLHGYGGP